jgi:putative chitinase
MAFVNTLYNLWPNGDEKVPGLRDGIAASASTVFAKYGINTPLLVAHVMAQISHECGAGHDVVENLNYTAQRMTEVWPSRFPSIESAQPYANNPKALANKVYNGRMGNRSGSDDGWNFRGRGGSQTTGREGYERVKKQTGIDVVAHPELLIDPRYFLECAVSDFVNCGCLPYAKTDDVVNVTKRLNGGTVGLAQREQWLSRWKVALGAGAIDFSGVIPAKPKTSTSTKTTGPIVAGGAAATAAHQAGFSMTMILLIGAAAAGFAAAWFGKDKILNWVAKMKAKI